MRIACSAVDGLRPPMERITSPLFKGRAESAGALTTSRLSVVLKYSPRSGLRRSRSRPHQLSSPKQKDKPSGLSGLAGIIVAFGGEGWCGVDLVGLLPDLCEYFGTAEGLL